MKKQMVSLALVIGLLASLPGCRQTGEKPPERKETPVVSSQPVFKGDGTEYAFRTGERYFERYNGEAFETFYAEGVNIGAGKPNTFSGEMGITKEEYLSWFQQIAEMHANTVRVYTVLSPAFYEAFYEYNNTYEEKLYLFQGCWYDEELLAGNSDAYAVLDGVKKDLKDLVDIFHGKAEIAPQAGHASGSYTWDISNYVIGWVLGIEPDPNMVRDTGMHHKDITGYTGEYLWCENVLPYEAFWCEIGDYALAYEDETYHTQRPVSFTNWPTTDMMTHPNEPFPDEDFVALNAENIKVGDRFQAGLFMSYHVYPYYPTFIYSDLKYADYVDEDGRINPYRAYLEDLISRHSCPVLVAEFGLPASRGVTHVNPVTGYNQGGLTEEEQGTMLVTLFEDIKRAGYAGGLLFIWQDEWFKRTWNTMDYTNPERRAYWNDMQTCEQHFGLLEFVSAENWPSICIDGQTDDWLEDDLVMENPNGVKLYAKTNSTYLYLMAKAPGADFSQSGNLLYFDITPEIGSTRYGEVGFDLPVDLVLEINGKDETRFKIHKSSDLYHVINAIGDRVAANQFEQSIDGFGLIYLTLDWELIFPETGEVVPVRRSETGHLRYGNTDEYSEEYDSLADFCYDGDVFEARIPWLLLGFRDPSRKEVQGYFEDTGEIGGVFIDGITVGMVTPEGDMGSGFFTWNNWAEAASYPRLRQSYYILQEYLTK